MSAAADRIDRLDTALFDGVTSQSNIADRMSWLAIQRAIRCRVERYAYLEIGSYLGGSMQAYLVDPSCALIYSIDRRVPVAEDDRPREIWYERNTTELMLRNLERLDADQVGKVRTFDAAVVELDPLDFSVQPAVCFIDGEHTRSAVLADFEFCLRVSRPDAVIYFHDAGVVAAGLADVLAGLRARSIAHAAAKLGGSTFAVELGCENVLRDLRASTVAEDAERWLRREHLKHGVRRVIPRPLLPVARNIASLGRR
jgi:hypothetical protein